MTKAIQPSGRHGHRARCTKEHRAGTPCGLFLPDPGHYVIMIGSSGYGFTGVSVCTSGEAAGRVADVVRGLGAAHVLVLDHEGAALSLSAALAGRLELA